MSYIKTLMLNEVSGHLSSSKNIILTKFGKFNPSNGWELRKELAKVGAKIKVSPKNILRKAASNQNINFDEAAFAGDVGVGMILTNDETAPALKIILKHIAANAEDKFEFLGGHIDGELLNAEQVKVLASLPSRDELRAQFLALLAAPMSQTLSVMEAAEKKLNE
jgi:large subunit ribosomal protein L10